MAGYVREADAVLMRVMDGLMAIPGILLAIALIALTKASVQTVPVARLISQRLQPTVVLSVTTLVIAVGLAVPIGVLAAWRAGTWIDRFVMGFAVFGFSVPVFVLGYLLIYLFAIQLGWLPVQGYVPLDRGL